LAFGVNLAPRGELSLNIRSMRGEQGIFTPNEQTTLLQGDEGHLWSQLRPWGSKRLKSGLRTVAKIIVNLLSLVKRFHEKFNLKIQK
jgi:hypothetical protein